MNTQIPSIDDMPHLKQRLGKARSDRIRYISRADPSKQKYATNITNTVIHPMQEVSPHHNGPVMDILAGASYLDDNQKIPLSVNRLCAVLQCVETINTREVMAMMGIDKRQAQRYVKAIKFALPHIERSLQVA